MKRFLCFLSGVACAPVMFIIIILIGIGAVVVQLVMCWQFRQWGHEPIVSFLKQFFKDQEKKHEPAR